MNHKIERDIILKLIHTPQSSFNELWAKDGESNTFAYHLNKLVEQGLVAKDDKYTLTSEGRKLSAFIEGDSGEKAAFPTTTVVISVTRDDGKILAQRRLKEPFYGYWGFVSGKINFGWNAEECAKRDLTEETGLVAKSVRLMGIEQLKTFEGEELLHHHIIFAVAIKGVEGELRESSHKAEHKWMTREEYEKNRKENGFPPTVPEEAWYNSEKFWVCEAERYMDNGKFTGSKLVSMNYP